MKAEHGIIVALVVGIVAYVGYKIFFSTSGGGFNLGGGGGGTDPLNNLLTKVGITGGGGGGKTLGTGGGTVVPTPIYTPIGGSSGVQGFFSPSGTMVVTGTTKPVVAPGGKYII